MARFVSFGHKQNKGGTCKEYYWNSKDRYIYLWTSFSPADFFTRKARKSELVKLDHLGTAENLSEAMHKVQDKEMRVDLLLALAHCRHR